MGEDDDATLLISRKEVFDETYAHARAWQVPPSERYPDEVKYSMQYGYKNTTELTDTANEDGTIIRYDNFPDHPGAPAITSTSRMAPSSQASSRVSDRCFSSSKPR